MAKAGLLLACLGALLLAFSTHLGVVSGFVGIVVGDRGPGVPARRQAFRGEKGS